MFIKIFDKEKGKWFVLKDLTNFSILNGVMYCEFGFGSYEKKFDAELYDIEMGVESV